MRTRSIGFVITLCTAALAFAAPTPEPNWAIKPVKPGVEHLFLPGDVRLLDGPFKTIQDADLAYLMRLEPDRLLAQFRVEAGLEPKAKPYGGWESPAQPGKTWSLAGHSLGHYLSALSRMYRLTDDDRLKVRIAYLTRELKECQDKRGDGSLVAFPYARELEADIRAGKVETIDKYWAPFYTIHKEMAGLRDAWLWCDDGAARDVLVRLADWCGSVVKDLPEERRERMLRMEHGGMAEVLADVYAITGDRKYLDFARLYSQRAVLDPLADGKDTLTGMHANTQIPKVIGFQRIYELSGDSRDGAAASFFWQAVVKDRSWVNGGNSTHEHFPAPQDMGKLIPDDGGPETCNTYNMLKLTEALYREKPSAEQVDFYENALFNHILPSEAPLVGAGAVVYYTPLRPDFARSYGTDFGSFWCCTGTGMENPGRYPDFIYAYDRNALTVNLFLASEVNWKARGVALRQETRFPDEAHSTLTFTAAPAEKVTLRLRHPFWLASEGLRVSVNGKAVQAASKPGGYAELTRVWKAGDQVSIELPMKIRAVRKEQTPGWVSFFYGPILLVGQLGAEGTSQSDYIGPYTPLKALRPLAKAPVVILDRDAEMVQHITAVPGQPCVFQTAGLVKPGDVTLAPFFRTHFQRYAMYWQITDSANWEANQRQIAAAELAQRELEARTIDQVRIGEQQPEIDHNLRFEHSSSGTGPQGRRWREARDDGWFSYELKVSPAVTRAALYAVYWGPDGGREFDILVDGQVIATEKLQGGKDDYFGVEYPLPKGLLAGKEKVTVRFQPKPGGVAGGVFDVRIVKAK
ncbi:MAG: beta-L-arabinofuranosidase domain-containing protein [Verrucomicrobiota bacterium]